MRVGGDVARGGVPRDRGNRGARAFLAIAVVLFPRNADARGTERIVNPDTRQVWSSGRGLTPSTGKWIIEDPYGDPGREPLGAS